jgi:hypothetical protein
MANAYEYDVVLSFAGENREYVDRVAAALKLRGVSFFYDEFEKVKLWGKDLIEYLDQIYRIKGRYCVMFISQFYALKAWPTQERRSAQARAFQSSSEYILPARFDDTQIPGVLPTTGYINLNEYTPDQFADLVVAKVKEDTIVNKAPIVSRSVVSVGFSIDSIPRINASLSEIEDTALQSMLRITTSDYSRKDTFPHGLQGGFFDKTNDRLFYQIERGTGIRNFKIQESLSLGRNGSLESIQMYRWQDGNDILFDIEKTIRHSVYLFNFLCRWQFALSKLLNHNWESSTVSVTATMPKNTILFDNRGFVDTDMEIAHFNGVDEKSNGSLVLNSGACQIPLDLATQIGRLLNFVFNAFEYSSFGKKRFVRLADEDIIQASQFLMAKVS